MNKPNPESDPVLPNPDPPTNPFGHVRHAKKRKFLRAISICANITQAARAARCSTDIHYFWKKVDPEYPALFALAWEMGINSMEDEIARRGFSGFMRPIFHAGKRAIDVKTDEDGKVINGPDGKPIGQPAAVREFSDVLAIFWLKGAAPHKYRDNVSTESRFVDKSGADRRFMLSDLDRLIEEADQADDAAGIPR